MYKGLYKNYFCQLSKIGIHWMSGWVYLSSFTSCMVFADTKNISEKEMWGGVGAKIKNKQINK